MSFPGTTPTKFGRYQVADPFRPDRIHLHDGTELKTADHEPPVPVLDQEDLDKQGIDTSLLIPGARKVTALGSCSCNAGTVSLAERWAGAGKPVADITIPAPGGASGLYLIESGGQFAGAEGLTLLKAPAEGAVAGQGVIRLSVGDARGDEEFAIVAYHLVTDQTGDPSTEWPPTDCGSTGLYVCDFFEKQGLIAGHKTATPGSNLISLLQDGSVIQGTPFFNAWMDPDASGFVDGDGSADALRAAIRSGVAGGHETCISAVEALSVSETGIVDPARTVLRVRNSWSSSWGDHGSFRLHLSTLVMLATYCDFKQMVLAA